MKILHVIPTLEKGGMEHVILNLGKELKKEGVRFDFLVERPGSFENAFPNSKIHVIPFRGSRQYRHDIKLFLSNHTEYRVIHTHTSSRMGLVLKIAKSTGIPIRIAHSHNARSDLPACVRLYKIIKSRLIEKNSNILIACSNEAARWLFPLKYKHAIIINNSVDPTKYAFSKTQRYSARRKLSIAKNEIAFVLPARLSKEKNHVFAIEVMKRVVKRKNVKLFILGEGPLRNKIKEDIDNAGLASKIVLLGYIDDIESYLSAFDALILPSKAEGLALVLVEAQVNGMPCIASDAVPEDANLGLLTRLPRKKIKWESQILNIITRNNALHGKPELLENFIISSQAKKLLEIYSEGAAS